MLFANNSSWYVGKSPINVHMELAAPQLVVIADGHELEYILTNFNNIPHHKTAQVQQWFGDIARIIVANLR